MTAGAACPICAGAGVQPLNSAGPRVLAGDFRQASGWIDNVQCEHCGFGWNRSMMGDGELAAFYSQYAKKVHSPDEDDLLFGPSAADTETLTTNQARFVAGYVQSRRGRVLDIGCGKGAFLQAFTALKPGWTPIGVEPSHEEAALARRHPAVEIHEGMFGDVAFAPRTFDLVTIMHVLEHVARPDQLLRQVHATLKPGGLLFVEVPNVLDSNMFYDLLLVEHLYHFCPETLRRLLMREGFEVIGEQPSTTYGALRMVARAGAARRKAAPPVAPVAGRHARWTKLWEAMGQLTETGAARAAAGRGVALFGAGMTAATWLTYTGLAEVPLAGCFDESPWKVGRKLLNRPVLSVDEIGRHDVDTLLIATIPGSQRAVREKLAQWCPPGVEVLGLESELG